jgi:hypothetical protein
VQSPEADGAAGEGEERLINLVAAVVADEYGSLRKRDSRRKNSITGNTRIRDKSWGLARDRGSL